VTAATSGFLDKGHADAVVSGLGLLSMARKTQLRILAAAFSVMKPWGCYIQFTYGPKSPVSRFVLADLGLSVRRAGFAFWNLPPATVYVYTRDPCAQLGDRLRAGYRH
jgi:phospholipid N-methyltransferase